MKSGFPIEKVIAESEKVGGYVTSGKLNDLQLQRLRDNLFQLKQAYKPDQLANITDMASGTRDLTQEGLGSLRALQRFPKETHQFMGRPLKDADFAKIDQLVKEGKLPPMADTMPITRTTPLTAEELAKLRNVKPTRAPENLPPASEMIEEMGVDLPQKTHSARATLLRMLDVYPSGQEGVGVTLREVMSPQEVKWVLEGGGGAEGNPIALITKYFGPAVAQSIPSKGTPKVIEEFIRKIIRLKDRQGRGVEDPFFSRTEIDFAGGGLAHILQVPRSGYSKGRLVKGALAILNRNKKNAKYMFNASDNVSPGYARGDIKYNAELLADQLAEDAGVVLDDVDHLVRTEFYGTAYDYLAAEMGKNLLQKRKFAKITKALGSGEDLSGVSPDYAKNYTDELLMDWNPGKGRKPSASGGLAGILEI